MIKAWIKGVFGEEKYEVGATDITLLDQAALALLPIMFEQAKGSASSGQEWHAKASANAWAAAKTFLDSRPK